MPREYIAEKNKFSPQEDRLIKQLYEENQSLSEEDKLKWNEIAEVISNKLPGSNRTGKQCRERWFNQLDPSIKHNQFTQSEIRKIFQLQNERGNKWAQIAKQLPGRTDNNVKNVFYSSLRRGLRHINKYISSMRPKLKIKQFKPIILTKILTINDQKHRKKLDIKGNEAIQIAQEVKNLLIELSMQKNGDEEQSEMPNQEDQFKTKIVRLLQDFNKHCKKRKQKRVIEEQNQMEEEEILSENIYEEIISQPRTRGKSKKNLQRKAGSRLNKANQSSKIMKKDHQITVKNDSQKKGKNKNQGTKVKDEGQNIVWQGSLKRKISNISALPRQQNLQREASNTSVLQRQQSLKRKTSNSSVLQRQESIKNSVPSNLNISRDIASNIPSLSKVKRQQSDIGLGFVPTLNSKLSKMDSKKVSRMDSGGSRNPFGLSMIKDYEFYQIQPNRMTRRSDSLFSNSKKDFFGQNNLNEQNNIDLNPWLKQSQQYADPSINQSYQFRISGLGEQKDLK